jgi:hypothetical protein
MFGNLKKMRAQSAMEYLMTYGWAILIIAVVLGVLFSLGIFSGNNLLGTACIAYQGYYCANPILGSGGTLTVTLGQNFGTNYGSSSDPVIFSCGNQTSTPNNAGFMSSGTDNVIPGGELASGQTMSIDMICAGTGALGTVSALGASGSIPIGSAFTGAIWINYQTGGANVVGKVASVSVKVS